MNSLLASAVAVAAVGTLAGCAQTPPAHDGMMMGQMPMMMGTASGPEMDKMMAMCMEHMQAMSARRDGTPPAQPPTR